MKENTEKVSSILAKKLTVNFDNLPSETRSVRNKNKLKEQNELPTPQQFNEFKHGVLFVPEITIEKYAEMVGVTPDTVHGWIKRGYLPAYKLGKYKMVNLAQRLDECIRMDL